MLTCFHSGQLELALAPPLLSEPHRTPNLAEAVPKRPAAATNNLHDTEKGVNCLMKLGADGRIVKRLAAKFTTAFPSISFANLEGWLSIDSPFRCRLELARRTLPAPFRCQKLFNWRNAAGKAGKHLPNTRFRTLALWTLSGGTYPGEWPRTCWLPRLRSLGLRHTAFLVPLGSRHSTVRRHPRM